MNKQRKTPWGWIVVSVVVLGIVALAGSALIGLVAGGGNIAPRRLALIEIDGEITDSGSGSAFNRTPGARDVIDDLESARRDPTIKAVVLRINSPGGSAAASQEMYHAVRRLGKPVVCSMGDLAASGGYYVASACDTIYANGSTLTGSIGVISQFLNYADLFKKVGLETATIKSGTYKDAGNPARRLTPQEHKLFQTMIMSVYSQFVDDVATGRKGKLTRAQVLQLADGRVYTGVQARANKLVDKLGGLQDAIDAAAQRAGIQGEPVIKRYSGGGMLSSLFETRSDASGYSAAGSAGALAGDLGNVFGAAAARGFIGSLQNGAAAGAAAGTGALPRAEISAGMTARAR